MHSPRALTVFATLALTVALSACSASESDGSDTPTPAETNAVGAHEFPVTIEHAYGTTTIESAPTRVATVAWANHEVPIALGVVPVGMAAASWGDDDGDGVLPWVEEALETLGAPTPVLFDETDGIDFEAVAGVEPDVILAAYSGLTQEDYDTLSKIAPVVAFPDVAWGTSWEEMVEMNSRALGLAQEGEALIDELHGEVADALAAHPELADKKVLFSFVDPADLSTVGFYTSHDTRPGFLESIGLPVPSVVADASATTSDFYTSISAERADLLEDVDILVTYGDAGSDFASVLAADPLLSHVPAIANGSVVVLENSTPLAASANPSPLSISWGIDEYLSLIASGAAADK